MFNFTDLLKQNKYATKVMKVMAGRDFVHYKDETNGLDFNKKTVTLLLKMFESTDGKSFDEDVDLDILKQVISDICFTGYTNIIETFKINIPPNEVNVPDGLISDTIEMFKYIWKMTDKECFNRFKVYLNIACEKEIEKFNFMSLRPSDKNIPNNYLTVNINLIKDNTDNTISVYPSIDLYTFNKDWDGTDYTDMYNYTAGYLIEDIKG